MRCYVKYWPHFSSGGVKWRGSWLRHCATGRKIAGSIPDGVIALGSTQLLTEMSTWGRGLTT